MPTRAEIEDLSTQVLTAPALDAALVPLLGLLRLELKRVGLCLGALQTPEPAHHPGGDYSRREWRYGLVDRSLDSDAPSRAVVLALEFTTQGANEGSATLLVEERPPELDAFDWNRLSCRSRRLYETLGVDGWAGRAAPVDSVLAAFEADGLLDPLDAARQAVLDFVQGFQP